MLRGGAKREKLMSSRLLLPEVINVRLFAVRCRYQTRLSADNGVIKRYKSVAKLHKVLSDIRCYFSQPAAGLWFAKNDLAKRGLYSRLASFL
jgi:hypothetical protein